MRKKKDHIKMQSIGELHDNYTWLKICEIEVSEGEDREWIKKKNTGPNLSKLDLNSTPTEPRS